MTDKQNAKAPKIKLVCVTDADGNILENHELSPVHEIHDVEETEVTVTVNNTDDTAEDTTEEIITSNDIAQVLEKDLNQRFKLPVFPIFVTCDDDNEIDVSLNLNNDVTIAICISTSESTMKLYGLHKNVITRNTAMFVNEILFRIREILSDYGIILEKATLVDVPKLMVLDVVTDIEDDKPYKGIITKDEEPVETSTPNTPIEPGQQWATPSADVPNLNGYVDSSGNFYPHHHQHPYQAYFNHGYNPGYQHYPQYLQPNFQPMMPTCSTAPQWDGKQTVRIPLGNNLTYRTEIDIVNRCLIITV